MYDLAAADAFRQRHSLRSVEVLGKTWNYLRGGKGKTPVLFLHGLLGDGYEAGALLSALEDELTFLAPTLSRVSSLDELAAGLEALLDHEHLGKVVLIGGSFGGILAQAFFHRRHQRVAHLLIFDSTGPQRRQGMRNRRNAWLWKHLPMPLLRGLFRLRLRSLFGVKAELGQAGRAAMRAARDRFAEKVEGLERATFLAQMALANEAFLNDPDDAVDLADWPGKIILIGPDDMPRLQPGQQLLERVFPQAKRIYSRGAGHFGSLLHPELYREALRELITS